MNENISELVDRADWSGIVLRAKPTCITEDMIAFVYRHEIYFTDGEIFVAQMLTLQGVLFAPHVLIEFHEPSYEAPPKLSRRQKKLLKRQVGGGRNARRGSKARIRLGNYQKYEPDFVFGSHDPRVCRAYVWTNPDGTEEVVHGIECKELMPKVNDSGLVKVRLLSASRGINIKVLTGAEILQCVAGGFQLPIRPLTPSR